MLGKVVIVTGASAGIGEAAAWAFAMAGARVVLAARRAERLEHLAAEIEAAGGDALAVPTDLLDRDQITRLVQTTVAHFGHIDVLANIAGWGCYNWLEAMSYEDMRQQYDVNVIGTVELTRQAVALMKPRRRGHILVMASYASRLSVPPMTIYASTKYALEGFSDGLRRELAPFGIRVSRIHPSGVADTEFNQQAFTNGVTCGSLSFGRLTKDHVAHALVRLVEHPRHSLFLGRTYDAAVFLNRHAPAVVDAATELWVRVKRADELKTPAVIPGRQRSGALPAVLSVVAAAAALAGAASVVAAAARRS